MPTTVSLLANEVVETPALQLTAKLLPPLPLPVVFINALGAAAVVTTDRCGCRTGWWLPARGSLQQAATTGQNLSEHVIAQMLRG